MPRIIVDGTREEIDFHRRTFEQLLTGDQFGCEQALSARRLPTSTSSRDVFKFHP